MEVIYDISSDSILDAPRFISAICGMVVTGLILTVLISCRNELTRIKFVSLQCLFSVLLLGTITFTLFEWTDFKDNYFAQQYYDNVYEIAEGKVVFDDEQFENCLSFEVDNQHFEVKSHSYSNRGYHTEDYNSSFTDGDIIRVYFVNNSETVISGYSEKVIVRIEILDISDEY